MPRYIPSLALLVTRWLRSAAKRCKPRRITKVEVGKLEAVPLSAWFSAAGNPGLRVDLAVHDLDSLSSSSLLTFTKPLLYTFILHTPHACGLI